MASPFGPRHGKKSDVDHDLATAIEAILKDDPEFAKLTRRILRAQQRLRKVCSSETWQRYLVVEDLANLRLARACVLALDRRVR